MFILWQNILQERILWRNMKELIQMKNLIYVCNAFLGHLEICKVLLANQVTKIFMKNNGLTPLHMASGTGKYEVCKILVKAWKKEDFTNVIFVILTSHKKAKKYNWKNVWSLLDLNPTLSSFFLSKSLGLTLVKNIMDVLFSDKMFTQIKIWRNMKEHIQVKKTLCMFILWQEIWKKIRI